MALKTWHKAAIGAAVVVGSYALYSAGKAAAAVPKKKKVSDTTTSPPPGAPIPTPDAPIPQPPGPPPPEPLGPEAGPEPVPAGAQVFPAATLVQEQDFPTSDNSQMTAPVKGKIFENPDGTFMVRFEHGGGTKDFHHTTVESAQLRLDSVVNKPAEWVCQADFNEDFDAWVCTGGVAPGDAVARGFLDTPQGPAPWFVGWDGAKYLLITMASVVAPQQQAGEFNSLPEAVQALYG